MHVPAISVCMSMYNASRYLRECIDSILSQTFNDFELLIVDDGSTDDSRDIVRSYDDSRIRLICNKHDYIRSLNILLREARGMYIARMDADDVMMTNRLEFQYNYMEVHTEIGVLSTSAKILNSMDFLHKCAKDLVLSNQDLLQKNPIVHSTTMLRTSIIREYHIIYDEKFKYAEDYRLWTVMAMLHVKIAMTSFVGIKYRRTTTQITSRCFEAMRKSAEKVKHLFSNWLCKQYNSSYRKPAIRNTGNALTVIIPFLNEGIEVVETVKSLRAAVSDKVDIIVINDFSTDEEDYQTMLSLYDVYYFLNNRRRGVAYSRDLGVKLCKTPYFLLLDAHMRVYNSEWLNDITALLGENDRRLLCAQTRQLKKSSTGEIEEIKEAAPVYGAYATFDKGKLSPGIDWNYFQKDSTQKLQPVACVLGAGYAASKRYWEHLRGLEGLKSYGCDEVYVSFKVWAEGGECLLLKEHAFGHIYRRDAPYKNVSYFLVFNYLLIAYALLPITTWCWALSCCKLACPDDFNQAWKLFVRSRKKIGKLKEYYSGIFTLPISEVLSMNNRLARQRITNIPNRLAVANQVYPAIIKKTECNYGIVEGKMAALIWLSLWDKEGMKGSAEVRKTLFVDIKNAVISRKLPINFRNGLCGIGWGLLSLWANKQIPDIDESILDQIDLEVQDINIRHCNDNSLYYGSPGIIAYVVCREYYNKCRKLKSSFSSQFSRDIKKVCSNIIKYSHEHSAVYYSYLYKNIEHIRMGEFMPKLIDWISFPSANPENEEFWSFQLDKGCLGYSIAAFELSV